MTKVKPLLVIGGGPKGVALAAKRTRLVADNADLPDCIVVERDEIGAHWSGKHQYTDGKQRLVTPPEHDVGFPYKSDELFTSGQEINEAMHELSWSSFLADTGQSVAWLHGANPFPTHKKFVDYLKWVHERSEFKVLYGRVQAIRSVRDKEWEVDIIEKDTQKGITKAGSGLVITGHGGPKRIGGKGYSNIRIADGRDFWENLDRVKRLLKPGSLVGVVGSGETAGAIALAILRKIKEKNLHRGPNRVQLKLICKQPSYFLRSAFTKDIKHFSDPFEFSTMQIPERKGIIQRADRGVVSGWVKQQLEESACVSYVIAEAEWPNSQKIPRTGKVGLKLKYSFKDEDPAVTIEDFDYLVFAWGFNDLWFLELFDDALRDRLLTQLHGRQTAPSIERLRAAIKRGLGLKNVPPDRKLLSYLTMRYQTGDINAWIAQRLQHEIINDLSVDDFKPKLFLPRLAGLNQGPGFPNLNCLGLLSDRIWASYL